MYLIKKIFELLQFIVQCMVILFSSSKFSLQENPKIVAIVMSNKFVFSTSIIHTGVKVLFLEGLRFCVLFSN